MKASVIGLLCCLLMVLIQDLKYRKIHVLLPLVLFGLSYISVDLQRRVLLKVIGQNFLFFITTLIFLVMYMSIRNRKILNPFQNYFGLGDLLFFVSITPLFFIDRYILFFIGSMVFSIVAHLAFRKMMSSDTVPLAGFAALFLTAVITTDYFTGIYNLTLI